MKKIFVLSLILVITMFSFALAEVVPTEVTLNKAVKITFNGEYQAFKNASGVAVYPISYNGTTYLPIRSISSLFKMGIKWEGSTQSIYLGEGDVDTVASEKVASVNTLEAEKINANLNKDIKIYYNNKVQSFTDANGVVVYPISYNGTTYLPVRAISNLFGAAISWDGTTKTVVLTSEGNTTKPEEQTSSKEFSLGSWEGDTYKNSYLGIQLTKPSDWILLSDTQVDEATRKGYEILEKDGYDEETLNNIKEQNIIKFAVIANSKNGSNIQVNREKNTYDLTIDEYVEAINTQLNGLTSMEVELKEKSKEMIAGNEYYVQEAVTKYNGLTVRQVYYIRTLSDDSFFYIIVTDTVGDVNLSSMLKAY